MMHVHSMFEVVYMATFFGDKKTGSSGPGRQGGEDCGDMSAAAAEADRQPICDISEHDEL